MTNDSPTENLNDLTDSINTFDTVVFRLLIFVAFVTGMLVGVLVTLMGTGCV